MARKRGIKHHGKTGKPKKVRGVTGGSSTACMEGGEGGEFTITITETNPPFRKQIRQVSLATDFTQRSLIGGSALPTLTQPPLLRPCPIVQIDYVVLTSFASASAFAPPPLIAIRTICALHMALRRAGMGSVARATAFTGPGSPRSRPALDQTEARRKGTVQVRTAKNDSAKR